MKINYIILAIAALTILGTVAYTLRPNSTNQTQSTKETTSMSKDAIKKESGDSMVKESGDVMKKDSGEAIKKETGEVMTKTTTATVYKDYNKDLIAQNNQKDIILFFNASWCPTCKATVKDITAKIESSQSNALILSVDYDTNQELRTKYGVTMQHTFVKIDKDMNQIKKQNGIQTLEEIIVFSK